MKKPSTDDLYAAARHLDDFHPDALDYEAFKRVARWLDEQVGKAERRKAKKAERNQMRRP